MIKAAILKHLDSLLGRQLVHVSKLIDPSRSNLSRMEKILFIRPGGIGDAVLLIPAIKAIKKKYPEALIDILAEKRNFGVFSLCGDISNIYLYDRPKELWSVIQNRYDVVIDTEQWHRLSAVIARLTRAPMLIGYETNERRNLFTHQIPYSHDDYEVYSFLNLVSPITGEVNFNPEEPFLTVHSELSERVKPFLSSLDGRKIVAIFPGGSIKERQWGAARFHNVAKLLSQHGYFIVVVGGKKDVSQGIEIVEDTSHAINLCGKLSLPETAAVLKESSLLISGDSGIMHIASGLGVKTLALFGPGIGKKWSPTGNRSFVINKDLVCSPCTKFGYTPKCKKEAECMKLITVEEVFEKAIGQLKE